MDKVSLIICTRNRSELLDQCLNEIEKHKHTAKLNWEFIIIDNHSSDNTKHIIEKHNLTFKAYIQSKIGLSHARNLGIEKSKGNWVVYLDDDAKINSDFFNTIEYTIGLNIYDAFTGRYLGWHHEKRPKWIDQSFGSILHFPKELQDIEDYVFTGCIMVIKKDPLLKFGGFPIFLGMEGNKIAYGEDTYIKHKFLENNLRVGINPDLVVLHYVRKIKYSIRWQLKQKYALGRDGYILYNKKKSSILFIGLIKTVLYQFTYGAIKMFTDKGFYIQNYIITLLSPFYIFFGRMAGKRIKRNLEKLN